jgi:hypothetical protein
VASVAVESVLGKNGLSAVSTPLLSVTDCRSGVPANACSLPAGNVAATASMSHRSLLTWPPARSTARAAAVESLAVTMTESVTDSEVKRPGST